MVKVTVWRKSRLCPTVNTFILPVPLWSKHRRKLWFQNHTPDNTFHVKIKRSPKSTEITHGMPRGVSHGASHGLAHIQIVIWGCKPPKQWWRRHGGNPPRAFGNILLVFEKVPPVHNPVISEERIVKNKRIRAIWWVRVDARQEIQCVCLRMHSNLENAQ